MIKRLAALWDSIPVKGPMVAVVGVLGAVLAITAPGGNDCDSGPLRSVYHPNRLEVLATCQQIRFQVVAWRLEHDGDYHVNGTVLGDSTWINQANVTGQHGLTVVEFVPGDPRPSRFHHGMILDLTVTKVADHGHTGWIEGHPVFAYKIEAQPSTAQNGSDPVRLAPPTEGAP